MTGSRRYGEFGALVAAFPEGIYVREPTLTVPGGWLGRLVGLLPIVAVAVLAFCLGCWLVCLLDHYCGGVALAGGCLGRLSRCFCSGCCIDDCFNCSYWCLGAS